ncbi:hypothetical protein DYH55_07680 [Methylovirgula sp. 4M-Z18]|nr:hypothetical protein DYH55_07680 [Methylovirgula sp. 4M-Z18]
MAAHPAAHIAAKSRGCKAARKDRGRPARIGQTGTPVLRKKNARGTLAVLSGLAQHSTFAA